MDANSARSPGSFRELGARLLYETFPDKDAAEVEHYLNQAVKRVRQAADTRPLPLLADIRRGTFSPLALVKADLSRADLSRANFTKARLHGARLIQADLTEANLAETNLNWADLSGANLSGANLRGAHISGANLSGANLGGADLSWTDLRRTDLTEADLSGADLSGALLNRVTWDKRTVWPAGIAAWIAEQSVPLPSGGYRIRGGGAAGTNHGVVIPVGV